VEEAGRLAPEGASVGGAGGLRLPSGWDSEEPVRRVTFEAAQAFAGWLSEKTGRAWRIPREREWEKAARGTDERLFPWGNFLDPAWCCVAESHGEQAPRPAPVGAFLQDVSPYGVRGLGGNVRDWVIDDRAPRVGPVAPHHRLVRGGHWMGISQFARCALRYPTPLAADDVTGFRLVCAAD
jgi:serine/threonine-protein kinase